MVRKLVLVAYFSLDHTQTEDGESDGRCGGADSVLQQLIEGDILVQRSEQQSQHTTE